MGNRYMKNQKQLWERSKVNKYNYSGPPTIRQRQGHQSKQKLLQKIFFIQKISSIYKFSPKIQHILGHMN